ncbi:MAG TPA: S1 RNA-binding domain-containing protein [Spirochaetota bacterium]|nr:S1 RNA-binding domain-containing protein [Spirochaetota bacterium]HPI89680.1 S1 RNA-binding domain-containing protein [Spirochaetota bacterium]HPR49494.1 S1 RNA-binding domain-containing protein [Spirochaetota bacterium]
MDQMPQEFNETIDMEHVADSALEEIVTGQIVPGEIVTIDSEFVYVNVGTKSDGRIPLEEFDKKPEVGEVVNVMLKHKRMKDGMYQFSHKAAEFEKRWQEFIKSYSEGNLTVKGRVVNSINKGKLVDCEGVSAFLPFSLTADLKGKTTTEDLYDFFIKSVDDKKRTIIVSRKDYLDQENSKKWEHFSSQYKIGDKITGKVVKFVEFGAFIEVEGIDALLHRNDMTWKKVFKQRKLLKLGEETEFIILDINREEGKISLGLKQLSEDPWKLVEGKYSSGDIVNGTVVTVTTYGAFIEIEDGIEGYLSNSDISWTKNNVNVKDYLEKGQILEVMVLDINPVEKKLTLGLKQTQPNPWDSIDERFPVESVYRKKIKKIVKFGIFVELEDDIDGLIHISDVSWDDDNKDLHHLYKIGDEIEFKILDIKKKEMKISCGVKQLTKSPWELISEKYPPRKKVDGVISGITPFGLFIKLEDDVEGLVHISEVSRRRVENLEDHFKIGDPIGATVLGVDVEKRRLSLSIKNYEIISEKEELEKIMKQSSPGRVTLGDFVDLKLEE